MDGQVKIVDEQTGRIMEGRRWSDGLHQAVEAVEHIERSHPLRVTLGQVVVHGYYVYTITCQCVEEDRGSTNEGLTLTGSHFGNLTLVQNDTTEELYVVVDHFPLHIVTASSVVVPDVRVTQVLLYSMYHWRIS